MYIFAMNSFSSPGSNPGKPNAKKRLRVAFLLADNFTLTAFASFVDVLRLSADEADRSRPIHCDWTVLSDTMNPVRSSCGVKVQPDTRLRNAGDYDYIVVVGGLIQEQGGFSSDCIAYLKAAAAKGKNLIGLCTGVFALYEAGLLEGYRCCVSWFHHDEFVARFEAAQPVSDQIFVVDRDRLTCSGGHGAAHLAAWVVEKHIGRTAATKSLSIMIINEAMTGENPQPGFQTDLVAREPLVKKALLRMRQNIESPETVAKMAEKLGVTRRKLERAFNADIGISPSRAALRIRLDAAKKLLGETGKTTTQIALSTGFCDASHFIHAFKAEIGMNPSEYRNTVPTAQP
ncbi:AraC family transcriptional regulator [Thalassospira tepidiphila MCCC 1A03514]|uniref:AraC family transcriptional regulator n=2 Tax=Thalassospira tepidiphila TaxID=393657 RepID=A0A853L4L2_9PROT|nr:AraC family transcriptional regulator [Thalassospira profundimaris WP0211]OAZ11762.1 AraC family transcriptional regulator [Thalassospira tepidiphila MCCC 1A03514]